MGADDRACTTELQLRALLTCASLDCSAPGYWSTSASWLVTCCLVIRPSVDELLEAREIGARVLEPRLVLAVLAQRLRELRLVGPRVDLGQQLPGRDVLALGEQHAHELAVEAAPHGDRVERRHRAEREDLHLDGFLAY